MLSSSVIPLWLENMFCINITFKLCLELLCDSGWSVWVNILSVFEKRINSSVVRCNVLCIPIQSYLLIMLLISYLLLFIFDFLFAVIERCVLNFSYYNCKRVYFSFKCISFRFIYFQNVLLLTHWKPIFSLSIQHFYSYEMDHWFSYCHKVYFV